MKGRKQMFYFTKYSTHFVHNYMALDIKIMVKDHIARKETQHRHFMGYAFLLAARNLLYTPDRRAHTYLFLLQNTSNTNLSVNKNVLSVLLN